MRPSVPRKHFGQAFAPGSVQFVTDAAKSETEAIQRNLVREIGHLLLDQESRAVKRYVKSVFQRNRDAAVSHYGRRNSRGGKPGTASQFQRRELVAVPALRRAHRVKTYPMTQTAERRLEQIADEVERLEDAGDWNLDH